MVNITSACHPPKIRTLRPPPAGPELRTSSFFWEGGLCQTVHHFRSSSFRRNQQVLKDLERVDIVRNKRPTSSRPKQAQGMTPCFDCVESKCPGHMGCALSTPGIRKNTALEALPLPGQKEVLSKPTLCPRPFHAQLCATGPCQDQDNCRGDSSLGLVNPDEPWGITALRLRCWRLSGMCATSGMAATHNKVKNPSFGK